MDVIIDKSVAWLRDNQDVESEIKGWITNGDVINYSIITNEEIGVERIKNKYDQILCGIECAIEEADIRTEEDIIFYRETDFPDQNVPVFTATSPNDFVCGSFGTEVYPIRIPKGTRLFYISAIDRLQGLPDKESEREFLLERGTTKLVDGEMIFTPAI